MNTISAIETHYKGYRFRSRLEARWAMFFDRVGVTWVHEPQPFSVAGEAYLPDFLVSMAGAEVVHEVKSLHEWDRIQPLQVYLAGKMSPAHEWRGAAGVTMRDVRKGAYDTDDWADAEFITQMDGACFRMVGPFPVADDHGGGHGASALHMVPTYQFNKAGIAAACLRAIIKCDVFCAHINTADAFGTLVEIGIAAGMGKTTCVSVARDVSALMPRMQADHACDDEHDLWFSQSIATAAWDVSDNAEARVVHGQFIRKHTPREFRLISGIGTHRLAAMTFGDPLDVANRGQVHNWGSGIKQLCTANRAAAEAVRAHRFDGR